MSELSMGDGLPSREELRHLEARVDARFQAVNARFSTVDRRFTAVGHRLDEQEHQTESLTDRFDARFRSMEGRFDATDARIDLIQDKVALQFQRERHEQRRLLLAILGISSSGWVLVLALVVLAR